ncbi:MAG: hypothetical protein EON48_05910 [Acetobacteraceae bacterium]|nr:MAG: hypothetical protein EON48_05910 [Acetobacteraceae bacterium]
MAADGSLTLGWTETELIAAISSNIKPTGPATDDSSDGSDGSSSGDDAGTDKSDTDNAGESNSDN